MLDLIVIGGGPAGYTAALRAGQVGLRTLLIERGEVGGRGLHAGVLPSKGLMEAARAYYRLKHHPPVGVEGIDPARLTFDPAAARQSAADAAAHLARRIRSRMEKWGVEMLRGSATVVGDHGVSVDNRVIEARSIIVATGTTTAPLPYAASRVVDAWEFSALRDIPERALVYGSGRVAVETAQYFALAGSPPTILVSGERLLPHFDRSLAEFVDVRLAELGVTVVSAASLARREIEARCADAPIVINCGEEQAVLPFAGSFRSAIDLDAGFPITDELLRTSVRSIYAVGSVTGRTDSAQGAAAQARSAIGHITGITEPGTWDLQVLYTDPEIAQIGATERDLTATGIDFAVATVPFDANAKALLTGEQGGFLRVLYEPTYGEVLGVQIVARHAADLIGEAAAMMRFEATVFDVAQTVHAHPTLSELFIDLEEYARKP